MVAANAEYLIIVEGEPSTTPLLDQGWCPVRPPRMLTQFGLQAVINMGVNLSLLPTKGMTLPFISYGGSSMLALGLGMGMLLALTRQRPRFGVLA